MAAKRVRHSKRPHGHLPRTHLTTFANRSILETRPARAHIATDDTSGSEISRLEDEEEEELYGTDDAEDPEQLEDGEGDEGSEEEDEPEDASEDIKRALSKVMAGDLEFKGAFSFNKIYSSAPNPVLSIDGLGTLGLPLSTRDAAAIKACAEQAPFGKADKTIVDKSVRDTWEIDASKVHFRNKSWPPFMDQTVREVCEVLGVNHEASKPQCELYKLLLYEKGSHFLPHVDTEKVDGMFATIVVVLPSEFTGGVVHVKHGAMQMSYDSSASSLTDTSVLAWYTDVEHEVKAITGGYRLALSFNLVHTTDALRQTLSKSTIPARLQHTLSLWQQAETDDYAPQKIIYLLSHKYSRAALGGSALKGADAHLVAVLDNVGKQYGIRIGLANLICTESGMAEDCGGHDNWTSDEEYNDGERRSKHDNVRMEEVEDTEVKIEHLVDLDGKLIRQSIDYDLETEIIPDELVEQITDGRYDHQEYEGYQGNYGGTLERIYRRTVLVMWPSWAHFDVVHGSEGFSYACETIQHSTSPKPTGEETELTEIILARASPSESAAVVKSVCCAAIRWKDLPLWLRAVKACDAEQSMKALEEDHIHHAVTAFGFAKVKPCLEHALERDPSDVRTLQFLKNLAHWVAAKRAKTLKSATKSWIPAQRTKRWDALKKVRKGEHKGLTVLALAHGVDFFKSRVLPLIKKDIDSAALLEYATYLGGEDQIPVEERAQMARDVLAIAIANVDFYAPEPVKTANPYYRSYSKPAEEPGQLERAKPYVKASLELGRDDLFPTVVDKLVNLSGLTSEVVNRRVKGILFPIISYSEELSLALPGGASPPALLQLSTSTSSFYVKAALVEPSRILVTDVPPLVKAMIASERPDALFTRVIPQLGTLQLNVNVLRAFIQELRSQRAVIDPERKKLSPLLLQLLKRYINAISLTIYVARAQGVRYNWNGAPVYAKPAIDALGFCLQLKLPQACKYVFDRLLNLSQLDEKYIKEQLPPLVPDLRALLVKHNQPLTLEPFATAFRRIMLCWVQTVMGPRPHNTAAPFMRDLTAWFCDCHGCSRVRTFLVARPAESLHMDRIGAPLRKHLEGYLAQFASRVATFQMIKTTPQGLTVTKAKALVEPARWAYVQGEGKKLLDSISADATELQSILGPDHTKIIAGLEGHAVTATTSSSTGHTRTNAPAPRASGSGSRPAPAPAQRPGRVPAAVPHIRTIATAASGVSSSKRPADDDMAHAQSKRRKVAYDEQGVIDLT